jgi:hypothetical protein
LGILEIRERVASRRDTGIGGGVRKNDNELFFKRELIMEDKTITVTCPKCGVKINNKASWFKKPGNNCPGCQLRLATERFKKAIEAAENLA